MSVLHMLFGSKAVPQMATAVGILDPAFSHNGISRYIQLFKPWDSSPDSNVEKVPWGVFFSPFACANIPTSRSSVTRLWEDPQISSQVLINNLAHAERHQQAALQLWLLTHALITGPPFSFGHTAITSNHGARAKGLGAFERAPKRPIDP